MVTNIPLISGANEICDVVKSVNDRIILINNDFRASQPIDRSRAYIRRIAVIGDSMEAQHSEISSANLYQYSRGYLHWVNMELGGRVDFPIWGDTTNTMYGMNFGVGGETTTQIKARISSPFQYNIDALIIGGGTNDLSQAVDAQTVIDNLQYMAELTLLKGVQAIVKSIPCRAIPSPDTGEWATNGNARKKRVYINKVMQQYCLKNAGRGAIFWDCNQYIEDPTSAQGIPFANLSYDGTHWDGRGAELQAQSLIEILQAMIPPFAPFCESIADVYDVTLNPRGNVLPNAIFTGTGGVVSTGGTGSAPDSWRVERQTGTPTFVSSLVANPDVPGAYWWQVVVTPTAGSSFDEVRLRTSTSGIFAPPAGSWMQGFANIEIPSASGLLGASLKSREAALRSNYSLVFEDTTKPMPLKDLALVQKLPVFQVLQATGTDTVTFQFIMTVAQSGGDVTFRFGMPFLGIVDNPNTMYGVAP